jgi:hypothetical protein
MQKDRTADQMGPLFLCCPGVTFGTVYQVPYPPLPKASEEGLIQSFLMGFCHGNKRVGGYPHFAGSNIDGLQVPPYPNDFKKRALKYIKIAREHGVRLS